MIDVFTIARQKLRHRDEKAAALRAEAEALQTKQEAFIAIFHQYLLSLNGQHGVSAQLRADSGHASAYVLMKVGAINLGMSYTNFECWDNSKLNEGIAPIRYVLFGLRDFAGVGHDHSLADARFLFDDLDKPEVTAAAFDAFIERLADLLVDHIQP